MAKQIKAFTFAEVLARVTAEADAEQEAFNKMTPDEQAEFLRQRAKNDAEAEELLKKLRGPGFVEVRVGSKTGD